MAENISDLETTGIIEKVPNIKQFILENPTCSFFAFMPILKLPIINLCGKSNLE